MEDIIWKRTAHCFESQHQLKSLKKKLKLLSVATPSMDLTTYVHACKKIKKEFASVDEQLKGKHIKFIF